MSPHVRIAIKTLLPGLQEFPGPIVIQALGDTLATAQLAMLSSPFRPSGAILIFSSAEYCLRVARRMFLTAFSPWFLRVPDFCLFFTPWWLR